MVHVQGCSEILVTDHPERQAQEGWSGDSAPLSEAEYQEVFAKVPRLTVEVVVQGPSGVLLTKRTSGPCAGLWHLPGGTVRFGEPVRVSSMGGSERRHSQCMRNRSNS